MNKPVTTLGTAFALATDDNKNYYVVISFQFPLMACSISIPVNDAEQYGNWFEEEMHKAVEEAKRLQTGLVTPNAQETRKITQNKSK